jgi:hypothetical protein
MARKTNETYTVKAASPLLRPGLTISTKVSKQYLVPTLIELLDKIREFNLSQDPKEGQK